MQALPCGGKISYGQKHQLLCSTTQVTAYAAAAVRAHRLGGLLRCLKEGSYPKVLAQSNLHYHHASAPPPLRMRALSAPVQQESAQHEEQVPYPWLEPPGLQAVQLKIIGVGMRGVSSVNKLAASDQVSDAEFWAIDSDKKNLSSCAAAMQVMEVLACDDASLTADDLARLALAPSAVPPERKDGGAGMAFVMGSSSGSPGGGTLLLQMVNYLRRQGFFVAVALTRPFGFEGNRKLEQADALVEAMEEVSNLVVVVDQDVLTKACAELTIAEASAIAENTLQYSVRTMLWALQAPEILKASNGAFLWHGRDLRAMRRLLFPPMMPLFTCPGHGSLGRGQAAIPAASLQQAGLPSMLSTLAEDAVRAACESPFLDDKMGVATAVLCVLHFPPALSSKAAEAGATTHPGNSYEYAVRSAVQVAAMTVQELAGPACRDIVVCPQLTDNAGATVGGQMDTTQGSVITMECSLLVLKAIEDSAGLEIDGGMEQGRRTGSKPVSSPVAQLHLNAATNQPPTVTAVTGGVQRASPSPASLKQASTAVKGPFGLPLQAPNQQQNRQQQSHGQQQNTSSGAGDGFSTSMSGRDGSSARTSRSSPSTSSSGSAGARKRAAPNWSALSELAGGTAATARSVHTQQQKPQQKPTDAQPSSSSGRPTWQPKQQQPFPQQPAPPQTVPPGQPPSRLQQLQQQQFLQQQVAQRRQQLQQGQQLTPMQQSPLPTTTTTTATQQQQTAAHSQQPTTPPQLPPPPRLPQQQQQQQQQYAQPTQIPRMADSLMTSLVAQSLDLPPSAARWRHSQRSMDPSLPGSMQQQPRRIYDLPEASSVLVDDLDLGEWSDDACDEGGQGSFESRPQNPLAAMLKGMAGKRGGAGGQKQGSEVVDLRSRVAGMLDKERA